MQLRYSTILPHLIPALAAVAAATVVLLGLFAIEEAERDNIRQDQRYQTMDRLAALRAKLEASITTSVAATNALAMVYSTRPDMQLAEFNQLAEQALSTSPSLVNIVLVRGTVIDYTYPLGRNEKAIGLDYRKHPEQWPAYRQMMDSGKSVIAGPLNLVQGGYAVVVRMPVYATDPVSHEKRFIGAISSPISFGNLLREAGLLDLEHDMDIAIRGRDGTGENGEQFYGSPALFNPQSIQQQVFLPGGSWLIAAAPRGGWRIDSPTLDLVRALGWILAAMAAIIVYTLTRHLRQMDMNESSLKKRSEVLSHQNAVLDMITHQADLPVIMETLAQLVELHHPDLLCSILLLDTDGKHLRHGAAPSLPDFYNQAINGMPIGEGAGSCGTAAFCGRRVIVEDIGSHPFWEQYRELAHRAGLRSCWSQPIKDIEGRVLGTLSLYQHKAGLPSRDQLTLMENYAALTELAIERTRTNEDLRLHDAALNVADNAIIITDRDARIVWANNAFTRLTGYSTGEALGQCCGTLVKSGEQSPAFYQEMWQTILSGRVWHGELTNRRKNGTLYRDETTITPVRNRSGEITHFISLKQDITERKLAEAHLKNLAFYDALTQLPNRRLLLDRLGQAMTAGKRTNRYGALMFLDLDNFKPLNDGHGHDVGDLLLIEAARRISACVREEDTVSRFGGDEFVVMLKDLDTDRESSATQAFAVAEKIREALQQPYRLELLQEEAGNKVIEHICTSSIGIALFLDHDGSKEDILRWADAAMYQAKASGRNTICVYPVNSA
ncbi:MAG: diguanylate cyclase [Gallionella sp.]|nr:diguanylate cyclase [Gallionella sp.]